MISKVARGACTPADPDEKHENKEGGIQSEIRGLFEQESAAGASFHNLKKRMDIENLPRATVACYREAKGNIA